MEPKYRFVRRQSQRQAGCWILIPRSVFPLRPKHRVERIIFWRRSDRQIVSMWRKLLICPLLPSWAERSQAVVSGSTLSCNSIIVNPALSASQWMSGRVPGCMGNIWTQSWPLSYVKIRPDTVLSLDGSHSSLKPWKPRSRNPKPPSLGISWISLCH